MLGTGQVLSKNRTATDIQFLPSIEDHSSSLSMDNANEHRNPSGSTYIVTNENKKYFPEHIKTIKLQIKHIRKNPGTYLSYADLYKDSLKLVVYSDSSFATKKNGTPSFRCVIFMADENN